MMKKTERIGKHIKIEKATKVVVFYFPWKEVSGGPIYLSNLAIGLSKNKDYQVLYIEYVDGVSRKYLENSDVTILDYNDERPFKLFPNKEIILVTPIYWADRIPILNKKSKIVFFNWHNLCIPSLQISLQCDDRNLRYYLSMVSNNSAEFFCDKAHWLAQEQFGVHFEEAYVPITIENDLSECKRTLVDIDSANIAVIGRLVVDKVFAVIDLIKNLSYKNGQLVNIYIIGDGECKEKLERMETAPNINMIFLGTLERQEMKDILVNKVDILFAMGTSALEGAAVGLPTVIIPNDVEMFYCDKYVFLFDSKDYLLGWGPNQIDELDLKTYTAREIIETIYCDNKKNELGQKCKSYYCNYHMSNSMDFLQALNRSTLFYKEFCTVYRKIRIETQQRIKRNIIDLYSKKGTKKVAIWGAGHGGKCFYRLFRQLGLHIDVYVDTNALSIKTFNKIPVIMPEDINKNDYIVYISLMTYLSIIPEKLEEMGFEKGTGYLYILYPNC